ncbi:hypothetical protein [Mariniflexile sp. AS56]|uniref:hypothetical protein n=1 Tax=Mariniflexile sp. AS56 TaxID=3063957 RepID=UPI0026ED4995|nr:hypothetical protein [Mariniflexile sp. AS56]MDO7171148.1 hypothetical protein [Mariniflexile sp. AS56]
MNLYRSDKVRFVAGFILIIIIYSSFYIFFLENRSLILPGKIRHLIKFAATIAVYFVGTYHLGKLEDSWMSFLWHIIHISGLAIITALGLFDWFITEITLNLRLFANSIQELLISPLLYLAMGLLNKTLKRSTTSKI